MISLKRTVFLEEVEVDIDREKTMNNMENINSSYIFQHQFSLLNVHSYVHSWTLLSTHKKKVQNVPILFGKLQILIGTWRVFSLYVHRNVIINCNEIYESSTIPSFSSLKSAHQHDIYGTCPFIERRTISKSSPRHCTDANRRAKTPDRAVTYLDLGIQLDHSTINI